MFKLDLNVKLLCHFKLLLQMYFENMIMLLKYNLKVLCWMLKISFWLLSRAPGAGPALLGTQHI